MTVRHNTKRRGAAQIEFVLSIMLIMFLIFWTWEMVMLVYTYSTLSNAAKEGVRYGIVHGSRNTICGADVNCAKEKVEAVVLDYAKMSFHDLSAISIDVSYDQDASGTELNVPPGRVTVDIAYTYVPYIKLPWSPPRIHASAHGRIVN
ncbi:MAG TPA: TadE family protein [Clostridia bacterium]|nr:TadE family protein [Clostridia bacterium]